MSSGARTVSSGERVEVIGPYQLGHTIGEGQYAKVKIGVDEYRQQVAIKVFDKMKISKSERSLQQIEKEINAIRACNHPHIVMFHEVLETEHRAYLVMEFMPGGELFDYIQSKGPGKGLGEVEGRRLFTQIISAIQHCHARGIVHRDIKPENILLTDRGDVKLADFGLSNVVRPEPGFHSPASITPISNTLQTQCGSPHYAAPELLMGPEYEGQQVDIWSCAVLLYAMLSGSLPFTARTIPSLIKKICENKPLYPRSIPPEAQNLIGMMLHSDPMQRPTLKEIRNHPWMRAGAPPRKSRVTTAAAGSGSAPSIPIGIVPASAPSSSSSSPSSSPGSSSSSPGSSRPSSASPPVAISSARPISIPSRGAASQPAAPANSTAAFSLTDGGTVPETPRVALREELMGGKKRPAERELMCRTCGKRLTARVRAGHVSLKKDGGTGSGSLSSHGVAAREAKNQPSSRVPHGAVAIPTPAAAPSPATPIQPDDDEPEELCQCGPVRQAGGIPMPDSAMVFSQSMARKHKQVLDNPTGQDDISGVTAGGHGGAGGDDGGLGRPNLTFDWGRRAGDERKDRRQEVLNALAAGAPRAASLLSDVVGGTSPITQAVTGSPPPAANVPGHQRQPSEVKSPKATEQKFPERDELYLAARNGNLQHIKGIINLEVALRRERASDPGKWNALFHFACAASFLPVLQILLAAPLPSLDVNSLDTKTGYNGLMLAAANGHMGVVQLLLQYKTINLMAKGRDGRTANLVARDCKHNDIVMYITSKMSAKPRDTALQKQFLNAIKDGDLTKVTHLLKVSAKAQAAALGSPNGTSGSVSAAAGVSSPAVPPLTPQSPPAKTRPTSASSPAAPDNEIIDLGFESIDKFTALHFACRKGSLDIVRLLLQQQPPPDVNALTKQGWSSLMLACMRGATEVVRVLLQSGADPLAVSQDGASALKLATEGKFDDIVAMLREHRLTGRVSGGELEDDGDDDYLPDELPPSMSLAHIGIDALRRAN